MAEREGFEPPGPFGPTVFKTVAIDHSATSPSNYLCKFAYLALAIKLTVLSALRPRTHEGETNEAASVVENPRSSTSRYCEAWWTGNQATQNSVSAWLALHPDGSVGDRDRFIAATWDFNRELI